MIAPAPDASALAGGVAIAMLARHPGVAGKTRLTAHLDPETSCALRTAILLDAIDVALAPGWPLYVYVDPPADADAVHELVTGDRDLVRARARWQCHPQADGDLGRRMADAMARTLARGHAAVVLIGSDAPDLPASALREAASLLDEPDGSTERRLVLGPAADGGFYLAAARHAESQAFEGVAWSQPSVLNAVQTRAVAAGCDVVLVTPWRDVDTPDDLQALLARLNPGARRTRALASRLPPYNRD